MPSTSSPTENVPTAWVIPCKDEEKTIEVVIRDIQSHCPHGVIYVVDNCSTDDTAKVARDLGVHVIYEKRPGKGYALKAGFDHIRENLVIMVDGDDTYDISRWRELAEPVLKGRADMSVGSRLKVFTSSSFRPFHYFGNKMITSTINLMFKSKLQDCLSGYRAFTLDVVLSVPNNAKGFEVESELTIQFFENKLRIEEIALPYKDRPEGSYSKLRTYHDGFNILFTIIRLVKDYKPLTFFGLFSLICIMAAGADRIYDLGIFGGNLFMMGVMSLFVGIILNATSQRSKELVQITRQQLRYLRQDASGVNPQESPYDRF